MGIPTPKTVSILAGDSFRPAASTALRRGTTGSNDPVEGFAWATARLATVAQTPIVRR